MITVHVGRVGDTIRPITLDDGSTVRDALVEAGMWPVPENHQVRRSNSPCEFSDLVRNGDFVAIVAKPSAG